MTGWSIGLSIAAGVLALVALGMTAQGYADVKQERDRPSTYDDVSRIRLLIAEFVVGAKLWRTYLGVGLTAASVVLGALGSVLGSLAQ